MGENAESFCLIASTVTSLALSLRVVQLLSRKLELDAKHELNLARQAGTRIWRGGVVVVVVEIVGRIDQAQRRYGLEYPLVGYVVPLAVCRLLIIEGKIVKARVTVLRVIEDIEQLHAELGRNPFSYPHLLGECHVDLPRIQRPDETVGSISKSAYESAGVGADSVAGIVSTGRVERWRCEGGRIDPLHSKRIARGLMRLNHTTEWIADQIGSIRFVARMTPATSITEA